MAKLNIHNFMKSANLKIELDKVISYTTHVATIDYENKTLKVLGWWSKTTSKHINQVAKEFNFTIIK